MKEKPDGRVCWRVCRYVYYRPDLLKRLKENAARGTRFAFLRSFDIICTNIYKHMYYVYKPLLSFSLFDRNHRFVRGRARACERSRSSCVRAPTRSFPQWGKTREAVYEFICCLTSHVVLWRNGILFSIYIEYIRLRRATDNKQKEKGRSDVTRLVDTWAYTVENFKHTRISRG